MTLDVMLDYPYAALGSLAVAISCSLLSPFVVFKRMAFAGEGVGHAGLGGIGVAFAAGIWVPMATQPGWSDVILVLTCVATALAMGRLSVGAEIQADAAIGVGLVVAMSVGIASLDLYSWLRPDAYRPGIHDILFGEPLLVSRGMCVWAWVVAILTAGLVWAGYRPLVFYTFDEEGALIFGVPVGLIRNVFLVVMTLAIVAAIRVVGIVLVTSLLIMPGLIGLTMSRRFAATLTWSVASGVTGTMVGLLLFIGLGRFTSGPVIVLVLAVLLTGAIAYRKISGRVRQALGDERARG